MSERPTEPGFYWARLDGSWSVVLLQGDGCLVIGDERTQSLQDYEWGPRIIPPDEWQSQRTRRRSA